ncbi:pitrilysin family protein [Aurantimonas sp. C2-6-R+9]|uniref:M16 family metallopeptidase n=1 Tax=unclassified Aurantimonas TaxID=2638230 RepID=UPI002E176CC2|nr:MULTISPECIES: pitrilysin family protein [unclassified Aurantimonas]MEC5289128.1 pitrilysin family protein [Aurantimonas sp. C2-3-R2]MEC5379297.1 pitrilysin family protein [Aurantimonas sp. C2-6-R+9]MEC5410050.1 pitrilysin family protein [Aurantimonas sp. C2-4-R8]
MSVDITKLSNGLIIATETMPHLESACLGIWVKAGARDEAPEEHGIAHLLEHMAFKGTNRRNARQIAEEIEDVGGEINAATSVETTSYYARVLKNDVPLALDILTDILIDSRFDEQELEREQQVILQEIGAAEDTPDDIVFDHFQEAAYRGQIVGRPILGTRQTVKSFNPGNLRTYLARHYSPDRMIVSAAGAVSHQAIVDQVQAAFGSSAAPPLPLHSEPRTPAAYTGGEFRQERDLMDAQMVLGFEGRPYYARDFYASQVLSLILGGGMSSRLFQEVRERRGLCYAIYAFHWSFSDSGIFGVHAATGEAELAELAPVIIDELLNAAAGITEVEVTRARAQMRSSLLMSQESPASRAAQIARQLLFNGSTIANEELIGRLDAITAPRLSDLAERLFMGQTPTLAAIGPVSRLPGTGEIVARLNNRTGSEALVAAGH